MRTSFLLKRITTLCLLLASLSLSQHADAQTAEALVANLIVPVTTPDGQRDIQMDRYPRLHVQLVNISDKTIRLWKDWNSWGASNLSLRLESSRGTFLIRRKAQAIDGDFSDFWTLGPSESVVLEIDMTSGQWDGIPDLYGETLPARLTALYRANPDDLTAAFQIWTGSVTSNTVEVVFH